MAVAIAVRLDHVPIARPRRSSGNDAPMMARLPGVSRAAPTPWKARAPISASILGARPHRTEAIANTMVPSTKMRRRPSRSPKDPPTSRRDAKTSAYASKTHCTAVTFALSSRWSTGSATLTTVLSMKTMLEPRIVAARTHGSELGAQGAAARGAV